MKTTEMVTKWKCDRCGRSLTSQSSPREAGSDGVHRTWMGLSYKQDAEHCPYASADNQLLCVPCSELFLKLMRSEEVESDDQL